MDVIANARELGKLIQKDPRFMRLQEAAAVNEADEGLQQSIEQFNEMRVALNTEVSKSERDQDKISSMNTAFHALYDDIMQTPAMQDYNEAKAEATELMNFIYQIITGSFNGFDPDTIEYQESGCSGSCDGCSGCSN